MTSTVKGIGAQSRSRKRRSRGGSGRVSDVEDLIGDLEQALRA
jgi:hypothetical protein